MTGSPGEAAGAMRRRGRGLRGGATGEAVTQLGERRIEQPGDVHLGDAKPLAYLGLGHVAIEAHGQDALLSLRQGGQVRPQGFTVDRKLDAWVVARRMPGSR
jgi:hypothetical protein